MFCFVQIFKFCFIHIRGPQMWFRGVSRVWSETTLFYWDPSLSISVFVITKHSYHYLSNITFFCQNIFRNNLPLADTLHGNGPSSVNMHATDLCHMSKDSQCHWQSVDMNIDWAMAIFVKGVGWWPVVFYCSCCSRANQPTAASHLTISWQIWWILSTWSVDKDFKKVEEHFPKSIKWVKVIYRQPVQLVYRAEVVWSESSFHQGDLLAGLLFSLVFQDVLITIQTEVPKLLIKLREITDALHLI